MLLIVILGACAAGVLAGLIADHIVCSQALLPVQPTMIGAFTWLASTLLFLIVGLQVVLT